MPKLLMIADDLTGALDTGIQLTKHGIETCVVSTMPVEFSKISATAKVVVVNTASRHLPVREAYRLVFDTVSKASRDGFTHFYKKTDSALRGNVGAELSGMRDALREQLVFVPAYPKMGRVTVDGIHLIDGIPVAESSFGSDPFTPVQVSDVDGILRLSGVLGTDGIEVFNAETDADLASIANLMRVRDHRVLAGCAGFAAYLPEMLAFRKEKMELSQEKTGLVVVTGSLNPVTLKQVNCAEARGYPSIVMPYRLKISKNPTESSFYEEVLRMATDLFDAHGRLIIKSVDDNAEGFAGTGDDALRHTIARNIGGIAAELTRRLDTRFFLIGGDVLLAYIECLQPDEILPIAEPLNGVVFVKLHVDGREIDLYTKSGGFGDEDVIPKLEAIKIAEAGHESK